MVPNGNDDTKLFCTALAVRYLATPPRKLPEPMINNVLSMCEDKKKVMSYELLENVKIGKLGNVKIHERQAEFVIFNLQFVIFNSDPNTLGTLDTLGTLGTFKYSLSN